MADSKMVGQEDRQLPAAFGRQESTNTVRCWYGNQCVITGANLTEGAHIVPVNVTSDTDSRLDDI